MKANELRIGNLVQNVYKDTFGISHETLCDFANGYVNLKPIPITEEWLRKFGLNNGSRLFITCVNKLIEFGFKYNHYIGNSVLHLNDIPLVDIKYVHQLQNIYFALTNEELKFNQDA